MMRVFIELTNGNTVVMRTIGDADVNEAIQKWKDVNEGLYVRHRIPADDEPNPINPVPVPAQVTMRQARLALHSAGLLAGVDLAIAGLTEPAKTTAAIEWEYAQTVDRASGLVPAMATALGMTEAQIDDLFILAATL